ncbi:MAG: L,D-transpeptidase [Polyangiales bacterium]
MLGALLAWLFVGGVTIRPYSPPKLEPEPEISPSSVAVVEITPAGADYDTNVLARPSYAAPLAGNVQRGARIAVRGEVVLTGNGRGCASRRYYALEPLGYICSTEVRPSNMPATSEPVLKLVEDTPLPYRYAMALIEEGAFLPMWESLGALRAYAEPERQLSRGDTVALAPTPHVEQFDGASYYVTVDGKVVPTRSMRLVENYSRWQGLPLTAEMHLPFGWVNPQKAPVYAAPDGSKVDEVTYRTRLDILEEQTVGKNRWLRIGDGRWMKDKHLNEVRKIVRPEGTGTHAQWFDVDLGEQTVVAYRGDQPEYATLTASGREPNHTPRGNYPIWGKVTSITMKSQEYDDIPYYVNRVPWVMFFQAHNALHGAYWHDQFGNTKSHGCVNLAPNDARYIFDWLEPVLPNGWTAIRNWDLTSAPVAHVHNTHLRKDIIQERNIGAPDKSDEADRVSKAIARREAEAAAAAASAGIASAEVPSVASGATASAATASGTAPTVPLPTPVPVLPVPAAQAPAAR